MTKLPCEDCGASTSPEECGVCPDCHEKRHPRPECPCGDRCCQRPGRCGYVLKDGELLSVEVGGEQVPIPNRLAAAGPLVPGDYSDDMAVLVAFQTKAGEAFRAAHARGATGKVVADAILGPCGVWGEAFPHLREEFVPCALDALIGVIERGPEFRIEEGGKG